MKVTWDMASDADQIFSVLMGEESSAAAGSVRIMRWM